MPSARRTAVFLSAAILAAAAAGAQPAPSMATRRVEIANVADARVVRPEGTAVAISPAAKTLLLRPGEYVLGRWQAAADPVAPTMTPGGRAWPVDFGFIGVTNDGREVRFRPVLETSGGLQLTGDASTFRGVFHVGLKDLADPGAQYTLPRPIALLVSAAADEVSPRQFTIGHVNLPFTEIAIAAANPTDALEISVQASGTSERATVTLPVRRPRLEVASARSRVQGLGLETSAITIRAVGLLNPEGRVATVTADGGSVEPARVTLDADGVGVTTLRSVSVGTATVRASSPPFAPATTDVAFGWPVAFLLAAALGGLAGAYLKRSRQSAADRKRRPLGAVLLVGVVSGVIVVALFAVGVNVLPVQPTATAGEALVFALAAVGSYVGLRF